MVIAPDAEEPPKKEEVPPCDLFGIKRTVKDAPNPRAPESEFPAIFSYSRNEHAADRDQLNVLGAVTVVDCAWNRGHPDLLNITWGASFAADLEVDGSAAANENTITASSPVFWRWVSPKAGKLITGFNLTVTPSFGTDRAFDREAWDVSAKVGIRSPVLLRMGLISTVKDSQGDASFSMWWQPTLQFEMGDVADAAGNEDLAKLTGRYSRVAPRLDVILWPRIISDRIAIKANVTERFNVNGASRSYVEATTTLDLTASGSVAFTVVYRHGRKPPDFSPKDQWLIGIGVQR